MDSLDIPGDLAERTAKILFALTGHYENVIPTWPDDAKDKLLDFFFGVKGSGLGVAVQYTESKRHGGYFEFSINGMWGDHRGTVAGSEFVDWHETHPKQIEPVDLASIADVIEGDSRMPDKKRRIVRKAGRVKKTRS